MEAPRRPDHEPSAALPRPGHPPVAAPPAIPPRPSMAPGAGASAAPDGVPPASEAEEHPVAPEAGERLAAPETGERPVAPEHRAGRDAIPPAPAKPELIAIDASPAAALRAAIAVVPGVAAVGEPSSRAMGRLRSAIGQPDSAGISVTEGQEQWAVDVAIVASLQRPLRDTARAAQLAAIAALSGSGRTVAEVNVEVLDAEDAAEPVGVATLSAGTQANPTPSGTQANPTPSGTETGPALAGHIRVSSRALRSVVTHLAARTFGVPAERIGVSLSDEAGELALRLNLPLPVASLLETAAPGAASLRERALNERVPLRRAVAELTGTSLSRVDVRVTGSTEPLSGSAA